MVIVAMAQTLSKGKARVTLHVHYLSDASSYMVYVEIAGDL